MTTEIQDLDWEFRSRMTHGNVYPAANAREIYYLMHSDRMQEEQEEINRLNEKFYNLKGIGLRIALMLLLFNLLVTATALLHQ